MMTEGAMERKAVWQLFAADLADADVRARVRELKVLVVDDDLPTGILLLKQIKAYGCFVRHVSTGKEALRVLEQESIDLLITDCLMQEMTGFELAKIIRERYPIRNMQVIGLSASLFHGGRQQQKQIDMDQRLIKPLSYARLGRLLEQVSVDITKKKLEHGFARSLNGNKDACLKEKERSSITIDLRREFGQELAATKKGAQEVVCSNDDAVAPIAYRYQQDFLHAMWQTNIEDMKALSEAVEKKNSINIAHLAHKLRGAATVAGRQDVMDTAAELENICHHPVKQERLQRSVINLYERLVAFNHDIIAQLHKNGWGALGAAKQKSEVHLLFKIF